ncbi:MAG: nuclear transport factor 2 family protein [Myxococcota bacterium]
MSKPLAQVLLERYWDEASNQAQYELVRELCADPIVRHDPGKAPTRLSHDEQIERLRFGVEQMGVVIDRVLVHADDTLATSVWNLVMTKAGDKRLSGIEVFRVADGRLAECWNAPYGDGHWDEPLDA